MKIKNLVKHIEYSAQLAAVLEVSGWPKPGNVHRTRDHGDARFEHFLAGSIALGSSIEAAALKGVMAARGKISLSEIGVGRLIKKAVKDFSFSHKGGNTHLGVCLLFIPLSAAAAKTYMEKSRFSILPLRKNIQDIIRSTTPVDAIRVYEAIRMVSSPRELGKVNGEGAPDLYDKNAKKKILSSGVTLFDAMRDASSYDTIARELVTGMEISFNVGFRELVKTFKRTRDINVATVHTFLRILSEFPDTFIARKIGLKEENDVKKAVEIGIRETMWISEVAMRILDLGGLTTEEGRPALWELDEKLQNLGKDYSPGTTADLTASSLMIALLAGLKF
ncbi:triphosphoribosyl-dephospho-CoA synthase [Candidatus Bathyarchaeota archaeon]|nr:triphosphoribosyl-dephospho-CoA synthase [Candidatus Bathyarchaeota archaeon]